jgi:hypothetical protein
MKAKNDRKWPEKCFIFQSLITRPKAENNKTVAGRLLEVGGVVVING